MSRWHDRSLDGLGRWANLTIQERIADRLADLVAAADDVLALVGSERSPFAEEIRTFAPRISIEARAIAAHLPPPGDTSTRDPELSDVLTAIDHEIREIESTRGADREARRYRLESFAAPYAVAFYFEIRRLDEFLGAPLSAEAERVISEVPS